ncbi:hypothetical protein [Paenibacillus bouchesdurhonensis]|uniref:hypothetical protein n=1 Tax=Paenibacillus bouchesdurhonensis TaxID=1870990 RepID=UPI000DA6062E|nr:hypothetical protein [Paenibacillus bouchesdurhonensis]
MLLLIRGVWILALLINLSAVMWFIFGTTANFQRGMDLVSTVIFVYFGIPSILLIVLSIFLIIKGWIPSSPWRIVAVSILILGLLSLSPTLFKYVDTSGWLEENVTTDTLQITSDNAYEYNLEIINLFQRNSYARLHLKSTSTDEEIRIPLDIPVKEIVVLFEEKNYHLIFLKATSEADVYILHPTSKLPFPNEKYKIDVKKKEAVKIP